METGQAGTVKRKNKQKTFADRRSGGTSAAVSQMPGRIERAAKLGHLPIFAIFFGISLREQVNYGKMDLPNNPISFSETSVFLLSGKNAYAPFCDALLEDKVKKDCLATVEPCVFRCAASAAHFFIFRIIICFERGWLQT